MGFSGVCQPALCTEQTRDRTMNIKSKMEAYLSAGGETHRKVSECSLLATDHLSESKTVGILSKHRILFGVLCVMQSTPQCEWCFCPLLN